MSMNFIPPKTKQLLKCHEFFSDSVYGKLTLQNKSIMDRQSQQTKYIFNIYYFPYKDCISENMRIREACYACSKEEFKDFTL